MAAWLQQVLKLDRPANTIRVERIRPVPWAERGAERDGEAKPAMQPERWSINLGGPNKVVQVEYWVGNRSASVRTTDNGFIATLTNFHKGVGMPVPWILLIDSLAGSLIFLSLSGAIQRLNQTNADEVARGSLIGCYHNLVRDWSET